MPGASRLSSIWAGRCAEEKTTTQRARSPSGDQFMVLALSLPVKKQISWCVFKRLASEKHQEDSFSLHVSLLSTLLVSQPLLGSFYSTFTFSPSVGSLVRCATERAHSVPLHLRHMNTRIHAVTYIC